MSLDAITQLAERMRRSKDETANLRAQLVAAMAQARPDYSLRKIGDAAGISRSRVMQILQAHNRKETQK